MGAIFKHIYLLTTAEQHRFVVNCSIFRRRPLTFCRLCEFPREGNNCSYYHCLFLFPTFTCIRRFRCTFLHFLRGKCVFMPQVISADSFSQNEDNNITYNVLKYLLFFYCQHTIFYSNEYMHMDVHLMLIKYIDYYHLADFRNKSTEIIFNSQQISSQPLLLQITQSCSHDECLFAHTYEPRYCLFSFYFSLSLSRSLSPFLYTFSLFYDFLFQFSRKSSIFTDNTEYNHMTVYYNKHRFYISRPKIRSLCNYTRCTFLAEALLTCTYASMRQMNNCDKRRKQR